MIARDLLYEGKAKKVFLTDRDDRYLIRYKDDATAFNGEKKGSIIGKGAINNTMSAYFFQLLQSEGVESHFVEQTSSTEMVVRRVEIIPLEVQAGRRVLLQEGRSGRSAGQRRPYPGTGPCR